VAGVVVTGNEDGAHHVSARSRVRLSTLGLPCRVSRGLIGTLVPGPGLATQTPIMATSGRTARPGWPLGIWSQWHALSKSRRYLPLRLSPCQVQTQHKNRESIGCRVFLMMLSVIRPVVGVRSAYGSPWVLLSTSRLRYWSLNWNCWVMPSTPSPLLLSALWTGAGRAIELCKPLSTPMGWAFVVI
jgi:hypothetical protein